MSCQQEGSDEGHPGEKVEQPGPAYEHGTGKLYLGYCQCGYEPGALSFEYAGDDLLEGVVGHGCLGEGQQQGEGEVGEDDSPDDGAHLPGEDKGGDVGMEEIAREEEEVHKDNNGLSLLRYPQYHPGNFDRGTLHRAVVAGEYRSQQAFISRLLSAFKAGSTLPFIAVMKKLYS